MSGRHKPSPYPLSLPPAPMSLAALLPPALAKARAAVRGKLLPIKRVRISYVRGPDDALDPLFAEMDAVLLKRFMERNQ